METKKVFMTRKCRVAGKTVNIGDEVDVTHRDADFLISSGRATAEAIEEADAEAKAKAEAEAKAKADAEAKAGQKKSGSDKAAKG